MASADQPEARVVGVDLTPAMLDVAREKVRAQDGAAPYWTLGDGLSLPFQDDAFDAVVSAFMMRNVPDVLRAFREQRRVVRPGGVVICLELTWPRWWPMSLMFQGYFFGWTPLIGRLLSGDREAYQYLPRSVKQFLTPEAMARQMERAGLCDVVWRTKMGATIAIYTGFKR
jgi:demethylmenaquinone methyltransferase/2-methoxy-6-polyprenyl-1,4-benzoquinol methylase